MAAENDDEYRMGMEDELDEPTPAQRLEPAPAAYSIEPELLQPTPRSVRVKTGTKIGRWIWIALTVGLPVLLAQIGNSSQEKWESLKDHGLEMDASLISKEARKTGKNGHPPRGTFQYIVDRNAYTITKEFTDAEYRAAQINDRRKIVYLPERPDVARMHNELVKGGTYAPEALGLWAGGAVAGLLLLGIWLFAERGRRRRFYLASEGLPVATSSIDLRKTSSKANDNNYKLSYTIHYEGAEYEGNATFALPEIQKLLAGGNTATVLVDPDQPKRNELYRSVQRAMEVIPATAGYGAG